MVEGEMVGRSDLKTENRKTAENDHSCVRIA